MKDEGARHGQASRSKERGEKLKIRTERNERGRQRDKIKKERIQEQRGKRGYIIKVSENRNEERESEREGRQGGKERATKSNKEHGVTK